jgi:outer membrane protein assembly factor BamB
MKYDSDGNKLWTKQLGSSSFEQAMGLTMDDNGNIYITGSTDGNFDGNTEFCNGGMHLPGPEGFTECLDTFVVKYDSEGDWKWTRQVDDAGIGVDIIADSNGDIYVASSNGNATLMKYDSDGNKLWTKQLDSDGPLSAYGLTMDDNGNIYITGNAHTEICNGLPGHDEDYEACLDAFVVKYDSEGDWKWTQQIGTSTYDTGYGITTDSSGNVYLTGVTSGNLDGNTNAGEKDLFVMKLK